MLENDVLKSAVRVVRSAGLFAAIACVLAHPAVAHADDEWEWDTDTAFPTSPDPDESTLSTSDRTTMESSFGESGPSECSFPDCFDPYPEGAPERYSVTVSSGRTVNYSTLGPSDGDPVLYIPGSLSTAGDVEAFAPYATAIDALHLRFIVPERTGYGGTPYDTTMTAAKYSADWNDLLTALGYSSTQVKVVGGAGGGVYADNFVTTYPSRVDRLHLTSAVSTTGTFALCPDSSPTQYLGAEQFLIDFPFYFTYLLTQPDLDVFSSVPGSLPWQEQAIANAGDPVNHSDIGLSHDFYLWCNSPVSSFASATFPTFIYHGDLDYLVPISHATIHASEYPNVAAFREYPNGASFVALRHLGQMLLDMTGNDHKRVICHNGLTKVISESAEATHLGHGDTLDICAWTGTAAVSQ
jgi:non-heme chloroperoxidase